MSKPSNLSPSDGRLSDPASVSSSTQFDFLTQLQDEAALQSSLHASRLLPPQLDWFTSLVGRYPWQSITVASFLSALVIEFVNRYPLS